MTDFNTPLEVGLRAFAMPYRLAGRLMIAFAVFMLATTIAGTIFFDALVVDVAAIVVFFLGQSVAGASRRAARWSVAVMGYYVALTASMLIALHVAPQRIRLGGRAITAAELPGATWVLAIAALTAAVCIALHIRALKTEKRSAS